LQRCVLNHQRATMVDADMKMKEAFFLRLALRQGLPESVAKSPDAAFSKRIGSERSGKYPLTGER
jgi:hypothetical protein